MQRAGWRVFKKPSVAPNVLGAILLCFMQGCASAPKTPSPTPPTSAAVGNNTTIVAIAPPAASGPRCSLPEFLGLPAIAKGTGGVLQRLGSRLINGLDLTGRFPGLQPQPPVLPITDPANLAPDAPPAVQAAAEIKQEEDAAPQKIMAIRYLATLGCGGCYEKVEEALLEGLSDCTEEVRYEAVKALQCKPECGCRYCNSPSCCSEKVRKRLNELTICEKEPSARIRRLARLALACCNSKPLEEEDVPREGPPAAEASNEFSPSPTKTSSKLFEGIRLVSFQAVDPQSASVDGAAEDMVLAIVNGEPIYESQILPLVEEKLRSASGSNTNDPSTRRKHTVQELARMVDWKIIEQHLRNEVRLASSMSQTSAASPDEIQAWFERALPVSNQVTPNELLAHYELSRERYRRSKMIRWELVTVKSTECSSWDSAMAIATYLRNRTQGQNIAAPVELTRDKIETRVFDWTELERIENASFKRTLLGLEAGQVSNPIVQGKEIHLVRLLERQEESYLPLSLVAEDVRADVLAVRRQSAELQLLGKLRAQSNIWTVFDSPNSSNRDNK